MSPGARPGARISIPGSNGCNLEGRIQPAQGSPSNLATTATLPNLIIRDVKPVPGTDSKLNAQIYNQGVANAAKTSVKLFYHRSSKVMTRSGNVPALVANGFQWVVIDVGSPIANASKVTLRVDDPNTVSETNELDNNYKYK